MIDASAAHCILIYTGGGVSDGSEGMALALFHEVDTAVELHHGGGGRTFFRFTGTRTLFSIVVTVVFATINVVFVVDVAVVYVFGFVRGNAQCASHTTLSTI